MPGGPVAGLAEYPAIPDRPMAGTPAGVAAVMAVVVMVAAAEGINSLL